MDELKLYISSMIISLNEKVDLSENTNLLWYVNALNDVLEKIKEIENEK